MKFRWYDQEITVDAKFIKGICLICQLPIIDFRATGIDGIEDYSRFIDLTFEVIREERLVHELCTMFPDYFTCGKSQEISSLTS